MSYGTIILASWIVFLVVWVVASFGAKPDVSGTGRRRWLLLRLALLIVVLAVVLFNRGGGHGSFGDGLLFYLGPAAGWVGAGLTVLGVAIAIWARFFLGRNWSAYPTRKEHHELVTSGPYRYVRHPIYTGVILAILGSALTGAVFSVVVLVFVTIILFSRIGKEEAIMQGLFPEAYPAYKARTWRLLPFVF